MLDVHGAVDQWIDAPEMLEDDQSIADVIAAGDAVNHTDTEDITVRGIKVSTATPKSNPAPALDASLATSSPTAQEHSDVASVHSLPVVHVTATQSPPARPSTARSPESPEFSRIIPSSSSRTTTMTTVERNPEHITARRSVAEPRTSNRLSGFFSNLIHRREPATLPSSRTFREDRAASPAPVQSEPESRVPSPIPARPVTPPPSLPPPTLHELGLSLSVITSDLAPSHFSTPPISGTFLAPHYLLLCHAQGLDVLPLVSPPAPSPYPLVRRVNFKSVVVMEHRGVLVAIAGRRDGVRVYALEEVKKAVEWRMDVEIRRERDRSRREESKRAGSVSSSLEQRESSEKKAKLSLSTPPMSEVSRSGKTARQPSHMPVSAPSTPKKPRPPTVQPSTSLPPAGCPPPYSSLPDSRPRLRNQPSAVSISISRSRRSSISHVLVPPVPTEPVPHLPDTLPTGRERADSKTTDWLEGSSDDEAIDMLTAGASGSQALDERTSSIPPRLSGPQDEPADHHVLPVRSQTTHSVRRSRPANLDLSLTRSNTASGAPPPEPSPSPTLLTLRQTLQNSPPTMRSTGHTGNIPSERAPENATPEPDADEEDDEERGTTRGEHITLAQALLESRLPNLPPAGSVQPQEPILISTARYTNGVDDIPGSPHTGDAQSSHSRPSIASRPDRRRRRWSVLGGIFTNGSQDMRVSHSTPAVFDSPLGSPTSPSSPILELDGRPLARSLSNRSRQPTHTPLAPRPSTAGGSRPSTTLPVPALPVPPLPSTSSSHSRLIPRILSGAFSSRRPDERPPTLVIKGTDNDSKKTNSQTPLMPHVPPLKLEYVKLPGTKGSLMIKAVETQKKSFLAILCGDNGEKVELFAGTYRTALGLSRTFILPDSPRSLELQLQGDDLVEVFLVFSQNVFGLEPATVRVREVRIGRAERRAARRRVREIRSGQNDVFDTDPPAQEDDDANVNISIGVSLAASEDRPSRSNSNAQLSDTIHTPNGSVHGTTLAHAEELVALASVQVGPYTTFQQLSFAPKFPLATIADDYVIPPTYPDFLDYRAEHEPDTGGNIDLALVQFSPPGLPMPAPAPPSRWFYRDPKGVVHGPWKASLMQAWYKDGLLPPDLPVRKEDDKEYILLKDLRQQCLDPVHPFRSAPPPPTIQPAPPLSDGSKPLLPPISLLLQPRHFGPPALFFSSRGGHSTSIVDARGRAVLKGRFLWSTDGPDDESKPSPFRMGDVKRLEAFDVKNRSVIVAMRQGGVEAMDFGDALLRPADESRTLLPNFVPPPSNTNRRGPFVWKIGTPISSSSSSVAALSSKSRNGYLGKKQSHMSGKSPAKSEFGNIGDGDSDANDEVIFLGRKDDDIYLCERNAGVFRILRLGPDLS